MKVNKLISMVGIIMVVGSALLFAQSGDFTTKGRVITADGKGIPEATISYLSTGKRLSWDFSDTEGYFGGKTTSAIGRDWSSPYIKIPSSGVVSIDVFDMSGRKIRSVRYTDIGKGVHFLRPVSSNMSKSIYLCKIRSGGSVQYCKMLPAGNTLRVSSLPFPAATAFLAKRAAAVDTIRVGKTGYSPVKIAIDSYTKDVGDVTLTPIDIENKVSTLLSQLSQAEKVGQLVQPDYPGATAVSSSLLGTVICGGCDGPGKGAGVATEWATFANSYQNATKNTDKKIPLLIGIDVVHGFGKCNGATVIPHNIGLGCTFNPKTVQKCYRVAGLESRSCGINFVFGPCIAVPRDDRWGRVYEGFAETPELTQAMALAAVLGFQTSDLSHPTAVAACAKHFAGDGGTVYGSGDFITGGYMIDRGNTTGDDAALRAIHLPGYTAAVKAGVASIMASFSRWNGTRMHENKTLLTDWLKTNQGFSGFINGDWDGDISHTGGTENCIIAGLDIPMRGGVGTAGIPKLQTAFNTLYGNGNTARVDDAVKRLLRIKFRMGLFSAPLTANPTLVALVGSQPHRDFAREGVRKSLVLLKTSKDLLPLKKTTKITLVGQHSQDIGLQCGGWTLGWLGVAGNTMPGTTIRQGFEAIGGSGNITYSADGNGITGEIAIVCIGEKPYAEWLGDTASLVVPGADLVTKAKNAGKKVIVVLMSGRPLDISSVINNCDAFIAAWLPGTEGRGIAEVLYGNYDFTGKLAFSWPRNTAQEPINFGDATYDPLFSYDYGLNAAGQQLPKGLYK